jgi:enoyl-CoA hydratase
VADDLKVPAPGGGVHYAVEDQIAMLTIDRPHRLNALDTRSIDALTDGFGRAGADPQVRVVVLRAAGDRAFCVGADLKEDAPAEGAGSGSSTRERGLRLFQAIHEVYKPTIAALNGMALGVGLEIALACDLRLATPGASLGLPEAKVGLGAMFGAVVLPRLLPSAVALQMLYTGEPISADEALRWGLVNAVVPGDRLAAETTALTAAIVANAPLSVNRFKHVAVKTAGLPLGVALRLDVGPDPYTSADRVEGLRAFREKRPPRWTGS